jgi:hypothetical protein
MYSVALIPRLMESPTPLMLRQWRTAFIQGKNSMPPLGLIASSSFFYLAYEAHQVADILPYKWKAYLTSGLLTIGIIPYTILILGPTNRKLLAKAAETSTLALDDKVVEVGLGGETAHKLVDDWATLNLGRGIMLGVAAFIGTWTALG